MLFRSYPTVGDESQVRWGTPVGTEQSGLGFLGIDYMPDLTPTAKFKLGTLTHYNNVIKGGSALSTVDLGVKIGLTSPVTDINLNPFTLTIDETTNAAPCVYPGATICPDKITISPPSQSFIFQGGTYSLDAFFVDTSDNEVNYMYTEEGRDTSAFLWGRVTLISPPPAVPAPLPVFGAASAFRFSRKLKSRISANKRRPLAFTGSNAS